MGYMSYISCTVGLLTIFLSAPITHAVSTRPNVLLIISDDLRDTVNCYGNQFVKTPNLNRFATRAGSATRRRTRGDRTVAASRQL